MKKTLDQQSDNSPDINIMAEHKGAPLSECVESALIDYFEQLNVSPQQIYMTCY